MAPLVLEGVTLGQKQRNYNKLVNDSIKNQPSELSRVNYKESDIENLLKIDVAIYNKDVNYILDVLKCEDMLYVSRVITKATWLITDDQYANIINPEYLNETLFPKMTSKAKNKLMLHIRLRLRNEKRVDQFYNYYKDDTATCTKWLPHCSIQVIKDHIENEDKYYSITIPMLKRLCQRSFDIFEIFVKVKRIYSGYHIKNVLFLLNKYTEPFLDLLKKHVEKYAYPVFNAKATEVIMTKCPQRILDDFETFSSNIHMETFAKHIRKEDLKDFVLKQMRNENTRHLFGFNTLQYFVKRMPIEERVNFIKKVGIEKQLHTEESDKPEMFHERSQCAMSDSFVKLSIGGNCATAPYCWYRLVPFEVAFPEIKKLIRIESSPNERYAMIALLLSVAGNNNKNLITLLEYYYDKHLNEPLKFKSRFVNNILWKTKTHLYNEQAWKILTKIFTAMEVFNTNTDHSVQPAIQAIVIYKILHDESIPEIIEKKLDIADVEKYKTKLTVEEQAKVLTYLFNFFINKNKFKSFKVTSQSDLDKHIVLVKSILQLLKSWDKKINDYPVIIERVQAIIKINKENNWTADIYCLYNVKKSWNKCFFEESLLIHPSENACVNALKHDPALLKRFESEVDKLRRNDNVSLLQLLRKLRVYYPTTLGKDWCSSYISKLNHLDGHKALMRGLFTLLPQNELAEFLKKYAPTETKINWTEANELEISLRKHIAKNMYIARPQPNPELILPYAKDDFLQYGLISLLPVLENISPEKSRDILPKVMDAPVSLQKHGIRFTFIKLPTSETKDILLSIWKNTKNSSIREIVFKQTFNLLCREKDPHVAEDIWTLMTILIDNLTAEENKNTYKLLSRAEKVPPVIRGRYLMKGFTFLKSLPPKANCEDLIETLLRYIPSVMESLDADFVAKIIIDTKEQLSKKPRYDLAEITASYLLCANNEQDLMHRYEILMPAILQFCIQNIKGTVKESRKLCKRNLTSIMEQLCSKIEYFLLDKNMVCPVPIFEKLLKEIGGLFPEENYRIIQMLKFTIACTALLDKYKTEVKVSKEDKWNELYLKISPEFSQKIIKLLQEDTSAYFSSIYMLFANALEMSFNCINFEHKVRLSILENILKTSNEIRDYLTVIEILPRYAPDDCKKQLIEICNTIKSHPSVEVKYHFYKSLGELEEIN